MKKKTSKLRLMFLVCHTDVPTYCILWEECRNCVLAHSILKQDFWQLLNSAGPVHLSKYFFFTLKRNSSSICLARTWVHRKHFLDSLTMIHFKIHKIDPFKILWHVWGAKCSPQMERDLWDEHEGTTVLDDIKVTVWLQKQGFVLCVHDACCAICVCSFFFNVRPLDRTPSKVGKVRASDFAWSMFWRVRKACFCTVCV